MATRTRKNGVIGAGYTYLSRVTPNGYVTLITKYHGTIGRGFVQFAASEGSQIINSEFRCLGDVEPGQR
jgi:hypothetical protein